MDVQFGLKRSEVVINKESDLDLQYLEEMIQYEVDL